MGHNTSVWPVTSTYKTLTVLLGQQGRGGSMRSAYINGTDVRDATRYIQCMWLGQVCPDVVSTSMASSHFYHFPHMHCLYNKPIS